MKGEKAMQQFRRTLLRVFMMLFLVAGVCMFVTADADAVFADEISETETGNDSVTEEAIVVEPVAAAAETSGVTEVISQEEAVPEQTAVETAETAAEVVDETADTVVEGTAQTEETVVEDTAQTEETVVDDAAQTEEAAAEDAAQAELAENVALAADETAKAPAKKHLTVYNGVDYALVYDYEFYSSNEDVKAAFGDDEEATLYNFVRWGMQSQRQGISTFDVVAYRRAYADLRRVYGTNYPGYYMHYIWWGHDAGLDKTINVDEVVDPLTVLDGQDYSLVYDFSFFQDKYPDVKAAFGDDDEATLRNFVRWGMQSERQGIATFDEASYRRAYADLRRVYGTNYPGYYMHYIWWGHDAGLDKTTGVKELVDPLTVIDGVDYSRVYDFNYFQNKYPDVKKAFGEDEEATLRNFIRWGMAGQRRGIESFDEVSYRRAYQDLRIAYGTNYPKYYMHYINYGAKEGRDKTTGIDKLQNPVTSYGAVDMSDVYDYYYYTSHNKNVLDCYGEDDVSVAAHFAKTGILLGRKGAEDYSQSDYNRIKAVLEGFKNAPTKYAGIELSMLYDFYYYYEHNSNLWSVYGADTNGYVAHFARWGMAAWLRGKASYRADVYEMLRQTFSSDVLLSMDQKAQGYTSSTKYLILINYTDHYLNVYERIVDGAWTKIKSHRCSMGASVTPTPLGVYRTSDKVLWFDSGYCRCWYATRFNGSYMIHSILYYQDSSPAHVMDATMGANVSHGCVRLYLDNAKWIYYNVPSGTTTVVYRR